MKCDSSGYGALLFTSTLLVLYTALFESPRDGTEAPFGAEAIFNYRYTYGHLKSLSIYGLLRALIVVISLELKRMYIKMVK